MWKRGYHLVVVRGLVLLDGFVFESSKGRLLWRQVVEFNFVCCGPGCKR